MGRVGTAQPNVLARLSALHGQAVDESHAGRPRRSERLLHDVLRGLDSVPASRATVTLRMRALISLAKVESELRGIAAGIERLDEARRLLAAGPEPVVRTALHNQRAALLIRAGRFDEAIADLDEAERYFRTATPRDKIAVLINRSTARMMVGAIRGAAADCERCADIAAEHGLDAAREMALHNLGYLHFVAGDLPRALAVMDEANQQENRGVALLDRARVLAEAGLVREADGTLAEAAGIVSRERLAQDLGEIELERARCALIAGDVATARRLAASARDRFRRRGSDGWRRSAELVLLQGDLAAHRPGSRLLGPALRLRDEFAAAQMPQAACAAALLAAEAALAAGLPDSAVELDAALLRSRRTDPITLRLHRRYVRAARLAASGKLPAAARQARAGLSELAAYQSTFGSIDLRTAAAVHGRRLAELDVSLALRTGRPDEVLTAVEAARAASNRLPVVRPPADRVTADLLTELRHTVESLHAGLDRDQSRDLLRRRRSLEARIAARGWALGGSGEQRDPVDVEQLRATAEATDSTVVTYVQAGNVLHAVVLGSSLRLHALGAAATVVEQVRRARADLDMLAQGQLPEAMRAAVHTSFARSARALDEALIGPLGLDGGRLVIVSTGPLGQVPWSALPSLRQVPVVVAPSATAWVGAVLARRRRGRDVVVLTGPGLAFAAREAAGVRRAWRAADVCTGAAADRAAFVSALGRAAVLHVAAHGTHQTENALFSSLRLADGQVFAHELDRTRRAAEHVVLSACELGLATVRPGDEALGLTSVLLRLGTRSVVAGVARVNDEITAAVMAGYHRRLAAGQDSADALAQAIAAAESDAGRAVAPFVCFGSAWTA